MAYLKLKRKSLEHNYLFIARHLDAEGIEWGVVSKLLCGTRSYLKELIALGVKEIHDSRVSNLKVVKQIDAGIQTVYIKPPAEKAIPSVIRYADMSFNTELSTIRLLSQEAVKQDRKHKVIIMIEMGDLREGVLG